MEKITNNFLENHGFKYQGKWPYWYHSEVIGTIEPDDITVFEEEKQPFCIWAEDENIWYLYIMGVKIGQPFNKVETLKDLFKAVTAKELDVFYKPMHPHTMTEKEKKHLKSIIAKNFPLKVTIAFPDPNTTEEWSNPDPNFQEREIEIIDQVVAIQPMKWGSRDGHKVYCLKEGEIGTHWHFVVDGL